MIVSLTVEELELLVEHLEDQEAILDNAWTPEDDNLLVKIGNMLSDTQNEWAYKNEVQRQEKEGRAQR